MKILRGSLKFNTHTTINLMSKVHCIFRWIADRKCVHQSSRREASSWDLGYSQDGEEKMAGEDVHLIQFLVSVYLLWSHKTLTCNSIGSSGRVGRGGGKKHEIYVAAFGGHLYYDLFVQGWRGAWPPRHPLDPLLLSVTTNLSTLLYNGPITPTNCRSLFHSQQTSKRSTCIAGRFSYKEQFLQWSFGFYMRCTAPSQWSCFKQY